jgi:hypothetical protein
MTDPTVDYTELLIRTASALCVFIFGVLWPEKYEVLSIAIFAVLTLILLNISSFNFVILFTTAFFSASVFANINYYLLSSVGLFETSWQEPLATDSQFFLYESRRFLVDFDPAALFSTWGSLIPVAYGSIALSIFQNHYLGIVYVNCILFTISILRLAHLLNQGKKLHTLFIGACLMPLQSFYNSMLSKEVLYLFLVIELFYLYQLFSESKRNQMAHIARIIVTLTILFIFRPTGAMIFIGIVGYRSLTLNSSTKFTTLLIFAATSIFAFLLIDTLDYSLPLQLLGGNDALSLDSHAALASIWIATKGIPQVLVPFFTPPQSIPLAPILGILWLISPIPLFGALFDALNSIQSSRASFMDFATLVRYFDSLIMCYLLFRLIKYRFLIFNKPPAFVLFLVIQIFSISSLQFFESGRHRYLPGFILVILFINFSSTGRLRRNI